MKRLSDLFWFAVAMTVFSIPATIIAIAILLDDGRPLFFLQSRQGRGRRVFRVLKFRTMRDGQVTRVGKLLRRTGLDELPQFYNILRGDMSFVGPRPLTEEDVVRLGWTKARFDFRWKMKPGITGLAQIHAGKGARDSLKWDRVYLRKSGLFLDTRLLAITFLMNVLGKSWVKRKVLGHAR